MALIIVRHGERTDYADPTWVARQKQSADGGRPWDPPLTARGRLQAVACGERLMRECASLGVPAPSVVCTSPFTRCVETAEGIASATGVATLCVDGALAEDLSEKW
jgi:broad specificity phosphatase PhoE